MRREHCLGVATEVGAGHVSDERLTPREELPDLQAELVARSRSYVVKELFPGCSFDSTRATFGLCGSDATRIIISAALKQVRFSGNANYRALLKGTRGSKCVAPC